MWASIRTPREQAPNQTVTPQTAGLALRYPLSQAFPPQAQESARNNRKGQSLPGISTECYFSIHVSQHMTLLTGLHPLNYTVQPRQTSFSLSPPQTPNANSRKAKPSPFLPSPNGFFCSSNRIQRLLPHHRSAPLMLTMLFSFAASASAVLAGDWRTGCPRSLGTSGEQDWFCWAAARKGVPARLWRQSPQAVSPA